MRKNFGMMAAIMAMAASALGSNTVYADETPRTPAPKPTPKPDQSFDERLAVKGLRKFVINDEIIIAHNEREAQKRYNHRHK